MNINNSSKKFKNIATIGELIIAERASVDYDCIFCRQ
jgi:hypothetical protein